MDSRRNIQTTLADKKLQTAIYSATARLAGGRRAVVEALPDYQELRTHAHEIKKHALDHLDFYLDQLERNVERNGGQVIWANTAAEAFALAQADGVALGDEVARAAKQTAERIVAGRAIAIEIAVFDRDGVLVGRAPFESV